MRGRRGSLQFIEVRMPLFSIKFYFLIKCVVILILMRKLKHFCENVHQRMTKCQRQSSSVEVKEGIEVVHAMTSQL